jgi:hypothetical protein
MGGRAIQGFFAGAGAARGGDVDAIRLGLNDGGGSPMPPAVRARMEAAFGTDFSDVRIHEGPQAARLGAAAFTTGSDIYFAPGRYDPFSQQGQRLLAHELTHVVQQRQGRVRAAGTGVAVVQDRFLEAEAERMGARAVFIRDVPAHNNFRQSTESRLRAPLRPGGRVLVQRHPLTLKVKGFNPWTRDTGEIVLAEDIELFRAKIHGNNPRVTCIELRRRRDQDHHVLVVGTEDEKFMQMDATPDGALLRYDVEQDFYGTVVDTYTPNDGLRLYDVFREFDQHTRENPFDFDQYNCVRFATDLACRLGTYDENDNDDFDFLN